MFYEAPHKLCRTLSDLYEVFGDRRIALVRELTKIHEEVFRTTLSGAVAHYAANPPRGEFVLVIEGAPEDTGETEPMTLQEAVRMARQQMTSHADFADFPEQSEILIGRRINTCKSAACRYYAYLQIFGGKNLLNLKFLFNFAPTKEEWRSLAPISIYRRALSLLFLSAQLL